MKSVYYGWPVGYVEELIYFSSLSEIPGNVLRVPLSFSFAFGGVLGSKERIRATTQQILLNKN